MNQRRYKSRTHEVRQKIFKLRDIYRKLYGSLSIQELILNPDARNELKEIEELLQRFETRLSAWRKIA